jgi:hypothetical protein
MRLQLRADRQAGRVPGNGNAHRRLAADVGQRGERDEREHPPHRGLDHARQAQQEAEA